MLSYFRICFNRLRYLEYRLQGLFNSPKRQIWGNYLFVSFAEESKRLRSFVHEHAIQQPSLHGSYFNSLLTPAHYLTVADACWNTLTKRHQSKHFDHSCSDHPWLLLLYLPIAYGVSPHCMVACLTSCPSVSTYTPSAGKQTPGNIISTWLTHGQDQPTSKPPWSWLIT